MRGKKYKGKKYEGKNYAQILKMEGGNCTFSTHTQTWKGVGSGKQGGSPKPSTAKGTSIDLNGEVVRPHPHATP